MTRHVLSFTGRDTIDAPDRIVEQHTGTVLTGEGLRLANENLARLAQVTQERDDARAELDNLTYDFKRLGQVVADMTANVRAWHQDRDDAIESRDEWRDRADAASESLSEAFVRIDELQAELDDVRGQR